MNVLVVGAGAMGCLFGGILRENGNEVLLADVWKEHIDEINRTGLEINQDSKIRQITVEAGTAEEVRSAPDLILVFTKSKHTRTALEGIKRVINDKTMIMTLQNGVGHVDVIKEFVDTSKIIHGITTYPCDIAGPGRIETKGEGYIKMMTVDGVEGPELSKVHEMFTTAGFNCTLRPQVVIDIWEKLAFNSALNSFSALLRMPVGAIGVSEEGRALAMDIVEEVVSIAVKKGIEVDSARIKETVNMALDKHRHHQPSMLQDILNKRETEIDFINGAVIRAAAEMGISLPVNEVFYRQVKALEKAVVTPL